MSTNKKKIRAITPVELANKVSPSNESISTSNIRVVNTFPPITEVVDESATAPKEDVQEKPKTIKLAESKSSIIIPPTSKNNTTKMVPQAVVFIRNYIDAYLDYVNGTGVKNAKESITRFARIITYTLSHQEDEVLDEVFAFFKKNRKSILAPDVALQGIYYLSANQQDKIQQVYTLFEHIASTRKAKKLDLDYASTVLGTGNIISYIAKRMV